MSVWTLLSVEGMSPRAQQRTSRALCWVTHLLRAGSEPHQSQQVDAALPQPVPSSGGSPGRENNGEKALCQQKLAPRGQGGVLVSFPIVGQEGQGAGRAGYQFPTPPQSRS